MSERRPGLTGDQIRRQHNLNWDFARTLGEHRGQHAVSESMDLHGKSFEQAMAEFVDRFKPTNGCRPQKAREYKPESLGEAFLQFAAERNATCEQVIELAFRLGEFYSFDQKLEI